SVVAFLCSRLERYLRRGLRAWMEGQWIVLEHEAHVVTIAFANFVDGPLHSFAEWTLEVGKLHDRDECGGLAAHRRGSDWNAKDCLVVFFLGYRRQRSWLL